MFDDLNDFATIDTLPEETGTYEPATAPQTPAKPRNWLVLRDGRPFLQVNATPRHVSNLVDGFNLSRENMFTYREMAA
ncbi:hypothetical protein [Telmatospirillum sp. J64-1]|uniref:hypothetical protein n=1 Tax=Telmatospirillum sp. J64-1 TaxID=2502183 RepID=UPI00115C5B69|nr:hypothetical protein [Telmatospirillum sp. J64-1]